ncbi:eukaryotic translation initiation factor 2-alpha kinase [Dipsacomyces acuminosporus]|nr:eukaryotic translation initiation factor 2-alpha kinase [Dipsacomyces acuminosporus]
MDDFKDVKTKTAWNVKQDAPEFVITIRPTDDLLKDNVSIGLHVRLTKAYPRTIPQISLEEAVGLSDAQVQDALAMAKQQISALIGSEMIYELALSLGDFITANNSAAQVARPSFHQQMVERERAGRRADIEREQAHMRRQMEAMAEEQHALEIRIREELERKQRQVLTDRQREKHLSDIADAVHSVAGRWAEGIQLLKFSSTICLDPHMPRNGRFSTVALEESAIVDQLCSVYDAYPTDLVGASIHLSDRFTVQCFSITSQHYSTDQGIKQLIKIKSRITDLAQIRHQNLVTVYGCHLETLEEQSQSLGLKLWVLSDTLSTHDGSTLEDVLESCGSIAIAQTRTYLRHILLSLVGLHAAGFIHRSITPGNILLVKEGRGKFVAKLFNTSYREELIELHRLTPLSSGIADSVGNDIRVSPEVMDRPDMMGRKNDIWCVGVVALQMALGLDSMRNVAIGGEPAVLESSAESISPALHRVLSMMLTVDHRQRPTAMEVLNDPFFTQGLSGSEPSVHKQALDSASRGLTFELQRSARMADSGDMQNSQMADEELVKHKPFFSVAHKNIAIDPNNTYTPQTPATRPPAGHQLLPASTAVATAASAPRVAAEPADTAALAKPQRSGAALRSPSTGSGFEHFVRPSASRYRTDFEEIEFLGKGGFGSVVKARNKIDGRYYAIKNIKLDARDTEGNKKIFREVTTLSRLHHQNVVRYYTTWVEDLVDSSGMSGIQEEESGDLGLASTGISSVEVTSSHSWWSTESDNESSSDEDDSEDGSSSRDIKRPQGTCPDSGDGDDSDTSNASNSEGLSDSDLLDTSSSSQHMGNSSSGNRAGSHGDGCVSGNSGGGVDDQAGSSSVFGTLNPQVENDMLAHAKPGHSAKVFSAIRFGTMGSGDKPKRERNRPKRDMPVREFTIEFTNSQPNTTTGESEFTSDGYDNDAHKLRARKRNHVKGKAAAAAAAAAWDESDGVGNSSSSHLTDLLGADPRRRNKRGGVAVAAGGAGYRRKPKMHGPRQDTILYIQMEYCENKTLNDLIKEGIDEKECWRLFGQILEGLNHIHYSGVIHRDLKPVNAFLDGAGDIKIGDFGLATSNFAPIDTVSRHMSLDKSIEETMTADIGTSTYVAPEVTTKGNGATRYNQKVDMYSLGIIFFEMCYPLKTGMERAKVLHNLRKPEIVFPEDFPIEKMQLQYQIIKRLLNHNPRLRPSSSELLESDLLPPKMEDEYIRETIRTIANPSQPYFANLMSSLFAHSTDKHIDATFDYRSNDIQAEQLNAVFLDRIRELMTKVFRSHAAVELSTPVLTPKTELLDMYQKPALYLDPKGNVVQLPYDQTVPFARYVARTKMTEIKRYCFDRFFVANPMGGQPLTGSAVSFDAVTNRSAHAVAAAEVISVACEVFRELPAFRNTPTILMISHMDILDAILAYCGILHPSWTVAADRKQPGSSVSAGTGAASAHDEEDERPEDKERRTQFIRNICFFIGNVYKEKPHSIRQRIQMMSLSTGIKLHPQSLDRLQLFMEIKGDLTAVQREVLARIGSECGMSGTIYAVRGAQYVRKAILAFNELRYVEATVRHFGVAIPFVYAPLFNHHYSYYEGGYCFQIMTDRSPSKTKPPQVLAVGGRYDGLLKRFRHLAGSVSLDDKKLSAKHAGDGDADIVGAAHRKQDGEGATAAAAAGGGGVTASAANDIHAAAVNGSAKQADNLADELASMSFASLAGSIHSKDVWQRMYAKGTGGHPGSLDSLANSTGGVAIGTNLSAGSAVLGTARDVVCIGVQIALDLVIREMARYQQQILQSAESSSTPTFGLWTRKRCDVVVASFGNRPLLKERIALARELWANDLRTDFLFNDDPEMTMERLVEICREQGMNWIVTLKRKAGGRKRVGNGSDAKGDPGSPASNVKFAYKVKNILRRVECEVPRESLCEWLHADINEQFRLDLQTHDSKGAKGRVGSGPRGSSIFRAGTGGSGDPYMSDSTAASQQQQQQQQQQLVQSPRDAYQQSGAGGGLGSSGGGGSSVATVASNPGRLELVIVNPHQSAKNLSRVKHKQRLMLTDRATSNVNKILAEVSRNAPVLVFDLGEELLRRLLGEPSILTDAGYKRMMELCSAHQRSYIVELRSYMERYKREGCLYVWLYSVKSDTAINYKL